MARRLFLFPTEEEAAPFRAAAPNAEVRITGVGAAAVAAAVARALREGRKRLVLAGIAGVYNDTVETGDTFAVCEERMPGLPERYRRSWTSETPKGLPSAVSNTVQRCGAEADGALLENMEGAVFFAMCEDAGVSFCEIRSVSNRVGDPLERWEADVAAESLAKTLAETFIKRRIMNKTKIIIWTAAAVIVIALVALLITQWRYLFAKAMTWVLVAAVSFLAGWLTGRFGSRKNRKE